MYACVLFGVIQLHTNVFNYVGIRLRIALILYRDKYSVKKKSSISAKHMLALADDTNTDVQIKCAH